MSVKNPKLCSWANLNFGSTVTDDDDDDSEEDVLDLTIETDREWAGFLIDEADSGVRDGKGADDEDDERR